MFFLLDFSENNGPGGAVLARFFCPSDGDFALSLCPGGGELAWGLAWRGWSGSELTDTLFMASSIN